MSKKANFFAIGVFVISASLIAIMMLIFFGSGSLRKHTVPLLATFRGSANGLVVGSKVKTYGVEIGTVEKIMIHKIPRTGEVVIPVLMEIDLTHVSNLMGYKNTIDFNEEVFRSILQSGACASLQMESIVTGMLYVEVELGVKERGFILHSERFSEYYSLPTVPTDLQVMISSLQEIVQNLGSTDFQGLIAEATGAIGDMRTQLQQMNLKGLEANLDQLLVDTRTLVNNPSLGQAIEEFSLVLQSLRTISQTLDANAGGTFERFNASMEQLQGTLGELEAASAHAKAWLDPSSAIYQEVVSALDQISDVSRSLRILIDYLERNPNSFITGRSQEESTQ